MVPSNNCNNNGGGNEDGNGSNRKKERKRERISSKIPSKCDDEYESHDGRAAATAASASGRPGTVFRTARAAKKMRRVTI